MNAMNLGMKGIIHGLIHHNTAGEDRHLSEETGVPCQAVLTILPQNLSKGIKDATVKEAEEIRMVEEIHFQIEDQVMLITIELMIFIEILHSQT